MRKLRKAPTGIEPIAVSRRWGRGEVAQGEREMGRGRVDQGGRRRRSERGRRERGREEREGDREKAPVWRTSCTIRQGKVGRT
jgi:hypothetical protein